MSRPSNVSEEPSSRFQSCTSPTLLSLVAAANFLPSALKAIALIPPLSTDRVFHDPPSSRLRNLTVFPPAMAIFPSRLKATAETPPLTSLSQGRLNGAPSTLHNCNFLLSRVHVASVLSSGAKATPASRAPMLNWLCSFAPVSSSRIVPFTLFFNSVSGHNPCHHDCESVLTADIAVFIPSNCLFDRKIALAEVLFAFIWSISASRHFHPATTAKQARTTAAAIEARVTMRRWRA